MSDGAIVDEIAGRRRPNFDDGLLKTAIYHAAARRNDAEGLPDVQTFGGKRQRIGWDIEDLMPWRFEPIGASLAAA
ncbi:hypothetical protein GCM10011390_45770 [Aureimonas endophytica]|uniref:Uncharacterized protein n=1 Tax=Aureimonas endophytica TaxID=2027858 RepID=A0A917ECT6_9HYPH|nr:hypothetical protein [Aureimonas endophytica]GGE21306.1 hypothetical protein GCM10011390_45770 [Aureimonas endophytica]